jgi:hypothetical protein
MSHYIVSEEVLQQVLEALEQSHPEAYRHPIESLRDILDKGPVEPQYFVKFAGWPLEEVDKKLYSKTHKDNRRILYASPEGEMK